MIPLFRYFWVRESDSDFIFTIWHQGHPQSGVKVHFSGNGIFIQSYNFICIFCICELNFHSDQAVVDFLRLKITMGLCNIPRSSFLIFTSFPPYAALISIVEFEVLNVLSFFFVILSHTQSRPSVNRSMANSTNMRCPISSRSSMSLDTLFHS